MRILFFRHGIAQDRAPDGRDASRKLTAEGVTKTRQAARSLAALVDPPAIILTSPKVRAVQTARLLAEATGASVRKLDALGRGQPREILAAPARCAEEIVVVVGHEPLLSRTAELLLTNAPAGGFLEVKKAGCACLEVDRQDDGTLGTARLLWLATPALLGAAGR